MAIRKVGVVGCGLMGSGIAQVAAMTGYETVACEVSQELLEKGMARIAQSLDKLVQKGTLAAGGREAALARLRGTVKLEDFSESDLVIEAVIESLQQKIETFKILDRICPPETIFASNTSSLSITEIMTAVRSDRHGRFVGIHFFNPVPLMKLVEVIRTILTDPSIYESCCAFAESLGKVVVRTRDRTGFIVNRLLVPYLLDAIRAFEEGVGSLVDIDNSMKLGCGHPMGPFTLLDFVGIDTTYYIANIMFDEFRERRFAPPPLMKRMVLAGLYGRKSGRGFYDYSDPKNPVPTKL